MLKEQQKLIYRIAIILDCIFVGIAFLFAYIVRANLDYLSLPEMLSMKQVLSFQKYAWTMAIVIMVACLKHFGVIIL
jgi:hypothetical protein